MTNPPPRARSAIREAAWRYYRGDLSAEDYRAQRRALIDRMVDERTAGESPGGGSRNLAVIAGISGVVVAAGVLAMLFVGGGRDAANPPLPIPPAGQDQIPTLVSSGALGSVGQQLVDHGWNDSLATNFLRQWSEASINMRRVARGERWYSRLSEVVEDRIDESMALVSAGGSVGPREQFLLSALAESLQLAPPEWDSIDAGSDADMDRSAGLVARGEPLLEDLPLVSDFFADTVEENAASTQKPSDPGVPPAASHTAVSPTGSGGPPPNPTPSEASLPDIPADSALAAVPAPPAVSRPAAAVTSSEDPLLAREVASDDADADTDPTAATADADNRRGGCHSALAETRRPFCRDFIDGSLRGPRMVVLAGGTFTLGSEQHDHERPRIEVTIDYPIALSMYETSHREYLAYCRDTGARCPGNPWSDEDYPVVEVSWDEANGYAAWLAQRTGKAYRLPSEAEWEYAARAGTDAPYPFGQNILITQARFSREGNSETSPLPNSYRAINANNFRLYHMVGNVREWVFDAWQDHHDDRVNRGRPRPGANGQRVVRGGAYNDSAWALRSAARDKLPETEADRFTGFRVALEFPQ